MATTFFAGGGKITTDVASGSDSGYSVIVQADGQILVAGSSTGDFALLRYNADGSLDATFGGSGKLTTDFGSASDAAYSSALQADGKIVVAGYSGDNFAVARYNTNGSLDSSFGASGKISTPSSIYTGLVARVQSSGSIQVGGYNYGNGSSVAYALVTYNSSGGMSSAITASVRDSSGFVFSDGGHGIATQADGKLLVAGSKSGDFALLRYNADRNNPSLDTSFGASGSVTTDFGSSTDSGRSVTVQADGKILVAGYSNGDFALVRYNSDGSLDTSFSNDGKLTTDFGSTTDYGQSVTVQADGKILVAGSSNGDIALVRYNADGSLDGGTPNGQTLTGDAHDDSLTGGAGNDTLDGGGGLDTAVFSGSRASYTIVRTTTGFKVIDNANRDGIDTLSNIETLQFHDQLVDTQVVNAASYETAVQEIYVAYFGRPADSGGLTNFENALLSANAPTDIAELTQAYKSNPAVKSLIDAFGLSAESARLYPGTTSEFVTAVFYNLFNRAPLSAGLNFWSDAIDSGTLTMGNAALSIMHGALANTTTQGLMDAAGVYNKIAVAANFTFNIDTQAEVGGYVGATAAAAARSLLHNITEASNPIDSQATVASTLAGLATTGSASPSAGLIIYDTEQSGEGAVMLVGTQIPGLVLT